MSDGYIRVADDGDLVEGGMLRVEMSGKGILLARVDGRLYAVDDLCSHEDASLFTGCLKGATVKCPLHGARFDLATGMPLDEPADEAICSHAIRVEDGGLLVKLSQD